MKSSRRIAVPAVMSLVLVAACDVTNPGRVEEEFIATGDAQQALINGAVRMMSEGMGYGSYSAALLAKEIFPGGQIGAFGHDVTVQGGLLDAGDDLDHFDELQQARFIAEVAVKRFTEAAAPDDMMYQAHLWAGWAYRVLGEWWCEAVIGSTDPDDETPGMHELDTNTYFERAVANFTDALGYASDDEERFAALAGRAQAYVWLEQWSNAEADAAAVTDDAFAFFVPYDDLDQDYFNTLYWAIAYNPYASYTMHFTWFKDYYETTGDPRTAVAEDPDEPLAVGSLSGYGPVEFSFPTKYASREDDQRLASGWEMRLVEAEAILAQGGPFADAMDLINEVRTRDGTSALTPWAAADATDAWTFLKRERAIETFLEGRRMGDLRRWDEMGTPGVADEPPGGYAAWQALSPIFVDEADRAVCLDIPNDERESNPNVPEVG
jgi:tetratricopeptide (TPR) repeat protein